MDDIFVVQDEIAGHIVKALLPRLGAADKPVFASGAAGLSPELHERFLVARRTFYDETPESAKIAHAEFRAIAEAAPDYAPAHSWLARTWLAAPGALDLRAHVAEQVSVGSVRQHRVGE